VSVVAHDLDTGRVISQQTEVADETDIGTPGGSSLLGMVAPLAVAQAATDIYDGPPTNETGRMCLSVKLREAHVPLQFCNRYVAGGVPAGGGLPPALALLSSFDVTSALGLLDAETFARLHVTAVNVRLDAARGLREANILKAAAPSHVRAGKTVVVRLQIRRFRAGVRTLRLRLRIPADALGHVTLRISGPSQSASTDALGNALASSLFGIGTGSSPRPGASLKALRKAFTGVGNYDGLQARFGHGKARHLFRDPALLITGQAKLAFVVTP
jgi:hypothetical protein